MSRWWLIVAALAAFVAAATDRATALSLPQGAYVWQQRWTPAVIGAIAESAAAVNAWHVLAFERAAVPSAEQQTILDSLGWPIPERYLPPNLEAEPRRVV